MDDKPEPVSVETLRERVRNRGDVDADEDVLAAIEERADDGRFTVDAFADWHADCREAHGSTVADLERLAERLEALLADLDPADRDGTQVRGRVGEFEDRFDAVRDELAAADDRLADTPRAPDCAVERYTGARRLASCERTVQEMAHALHHIEEELDAFETWLDDPATRIAELDEEVRGFGEYLDNTEGLIERLEADGADPPDGFEPFDAWLAAHHLQAVMAVVFEELRADLADLDAWLERRDADRDTGALHDRLAALEERHAACSDRLDAATETIDGFDESRAAVADSLARFDERLAALERPVDWGEVDRLLREQFEALEIRMTG
jgi:chromosome segregation ATPase